MSEVLVVEDEAAIAELIEINLRHAGYQVRVSLTGEAAQAEVDRKLPDIVVLDWMLPGISGVDLARRWRDDPRTRELPIVMLTARIAEADMVCGLDAGADDYLSKPFSVNGLLARLRAVLRRRSPEAADVTIELGDLRLNPVTRRVIRRARDGAEAEVRVGPTEFRLLHFLMAHPERVHTRAQLLEHVWGSGVMIEERTVDVHVKRLRHALTPTHASALLETVRGVGYRLAHPRRAHRVDGG